MNFPSTEYPYQANELIHYFVLVMKLYELWVKMQLSTCNDLL